MSNEQYKQYLQGKEWADIRISVIESRKNCERCGNGRGLQVHHKTYENIFKEEPSDLELLCNKCHKEHHGIKKPKRKKYRYKLVDSSEITLKSIDIVNSGFLDVSIFSEEKKIVFYDVDKKDMDIFIWGQQASYACATYWYKTATMELGSKKKTLFKGVVKTKEDFLNAMNKAQIVITKK